MIGAMSAIARDESWKSGRVEVLRGAQLDAAQKKLRKD